MSTQSSAGKDADRPVVRNADFAGALLDPDVEIPDGVVGLDGDVSQKRYAVYRNNVVVSLMDALEQTFPALQTIMGEEVFRRISRNFVAMHPPKSAMMQVYGEEFARFLDEFAPLRKSRFLGDVARVEFAWLEAYHAADAAIVHPEALGAIAPEKVVELVFQAHPAASMIASDYPIADLFAWRDGRPEQGTDLTKSQTVLISRPELQVIMSTVKPDQAVFLGSLLDGDTLGSAAEKAMNIEESFDLAGTLAIALSAGMFTSFQE